jgi:hypothetical protein
MTKITTRGGSRIGPKGIDMESEVMKDEAPTGQVVERWKAWDEV